MLTAGRQEKIMSEDDGRMRPTDRTFVQSVRRACAVLRTLADSDRSLTSNQIAEDLGLDRTVTYRLLQTLESEGLAERSSAGFRLGCESARLGNAYVDRLPLFRSALPHVAALRAKIRSTWVISVAIQVGTGMECIDRTLGDAPLTNIIEAGIRLPLDRSALGKCMMAYMGDDSVAALLGGERLAELQPLLRKVRAQGGIALASGELKAGISAVAATIFTPAKVAVAAIAVSGADLGEELNAKSNLARRLRETADIIGYSLISDE
jgi:DNA-binding IclR family transcriptional regulator